jgi:hypothetical protein
VGIWIFIGIVALLKLPLAAVMLWYPFRKERLESQVENEGPQAEEGDDGDGGGGPTRPRLPAPRRGPHNEPPPPSPARVRLPWSSRLRRQRVTHQEAS